MKEVARHLLHRLGVKRPLDQLEPDGRADRFSRIYADSVWRRGDSSTAESGQGSSLDATTEWRSSLPVLFDLLGSRNIAGHWLRRLHLDAGDVDSATPFNSDIRSGDFRALNVERSPFRFPRPERTIGDGTVMEGRLIGVWPASALKQALGC